MDRSWDKSKPPQGPFVLNQDCPQSQGLVAWYPMGGASASKLLPDYAGRSHLSSGGSPVMTLGAYGEPVADMGSGNYFTTSTLPPSLTVPLTLAAWGKVSASSFILSLHKAAPSYATRCNIQLDNTNALAATSRGSGYREALKAFAVSGYGIWRHVAGVFASQFSTQAYADGVGGTVNTGDAGVENSWTLIDIGRLTDGTTPLYVTGQAGECCVWNYAVPADIMARIANPGFKFELWYPLRSRKWFTQAATALPTLNTPTYTAVTAVGATPVVSYSY